MKIFSRQTLNTFIIGICVGITAILTYMLLTGNLPWLKAAGVGTGAPDVNARYLDGYGTAVNATSANSIYVSDANGNLPMVAPSGMITMFDTSCPSGWTRVTGLDGKFLVGGASYNASEGGSNTTTISVAQLPAHAHTGSAITLSGLAKPMRWPTYQAQASSNHSGASNFNGLGNNEAYTYAPSASAGATGSAGSGAAIDNRPEYALIVICKKD